MPSARVDDAAARLYAVQPGDFTERRDELARAARDAGHRDEAKLIAGFRKPTVAAWLVNQLSRERPDELADFTELGAALRDAEAALQGADLRRLGQQRQQLVSALVTDARNLAQGRGQRVGEATLRDVEATLRAALADEDAAELVRSGRLTTALDPSGFGGGGEAAARGARGADGTTDAASGRRAADASSSPARRTPAAQQQPGPKLPGPEQRGPRQPGPQQDAPARRQAQREQDRSRLAEELSTAWTQASDAAEARDAAAAARKTATARRDSLERDLRALRERLAAVQHEVDEAQASADVAEREAADADRDAAETSAAADETRAHVRDLQRRLDRL